MRNRGIFDYSDNLEVRKQAPLDARSITGTESDLVLPGTWEDKDHKVWLYDGLMVVSVDTLDIFLLKDKDDYRNPQSWKSPTKETAVKISSIEASLGEVTAQLALAVFQAATSLSSEAKANQIELTVSYINETVTSSDTQIIPAVTDNLAGVMLPAQKQALEDATSKLALAVFQAATALSAEAKSDQVELTISYINETVTSSDTQIIPAVTGNKAGVMLPAQKQALEQATSDITDIYGILYKTTASITLTSNISGNIIEKGVSKSVTLNWDYKFNGETAVPDTLILSSGATQLVTDKTVKTYSELISETKTYTVVGTKAGVSVSKELTINAYYPMFFGGSAIATPDETLVFGLDKQKIKASPAGTYSLTNAESEYMYFCVPDTMTINSIKVSGFDVDYTLNSTISTSKGQYKCYRTVGPLHAGTQSYVIS